MVASPPERPDVFFLMVAGTSVSEVSSSREHHREPVLVCSGDHLGVAHRSAGLHHGGRARARHGVQAVPEREERVGGCHRPPVSAGSMRLSSPRRSASRSSAAPIAGVRRASVRITVFDGARRDATRSGAPSIPPRSAASVATRRPSALRRHGRLAATRSRSGRRRAQNGPHSAPVMNASKSAVTTRIGLARQQSPAPPAGAITAR